jgi:hypothetical protein
MTDCFQPVEKVHKITYNVLKAFKACKKPYLIVTKSDLIRGHTVSCGCRKRKYCLNDIVNNRQIIGFIGSKENNPNYYYYQCKCLLCGREYEASAQTLDRTFSCGCQKSIGEFNIV